jgi:zinc and cadmium transporter
MSDYLDVAFWALVGGLFSIIGGTLLLVNKRVANKIGTVLTPFAAGALLGAAFFDLLPEAVEINAEGAAFRWAVVGILTFFLLEHYLHWFHHHHEHKSKEFKKPTPPLIIIGDTLHNAIDGVAIGAAFVISPATGIVTAIAVAAHEIPQEIGDFSILLKSGMRRLRVLMWNAVSALATLVAALYTFYLGSNESLPLGAILGLSAGLFIYIASSDLIPTIHEEAKGRFSRFAAVLLILGVLVVGTVTDIAHERIHETTQSDQVQVHED